MNNLGWPLWPLNHHIYDGRANATATIKLSDVGIDKDVPKVGDEVKIANQVEATED